MVRRPELEDMLRERFAGFSSSPMPAVEPAAGRRPRRRALPACPSAGPRRGSWRSLGDATVYAMAGVPGEMRGDDGAASSSPSWRARRRSVIASTVLRITGMGESAVAEVLEDLFAASTNPTIAYLASMGEVKVRLTAKAARTRPRPTRCSAPLAAEVRARLGDVVFSDDDASLEATVGEPPRRAGRPARVRRVAHRRRGGARGSPRCPGASAWFAGLGRRVHGHREARGPRRARPR